MFNKNLLIRYIIIFFLTTPLYASNETYIVTRIDNQIITNYDIEKEYFYLSALNIQIKNLDKKQGIKIAKESLIREKIKKIEISKYYEINNLESDLTEVLIKNLYENLQIKSLNEFKEYLSDFNLDYEEVKEKIKIEIFWNKLIQSKYSSMININIDNIKKKIQEKELESQNTKEFDLYEIFFQIEKQSEFTSKLEEIKKSITTNGFKNTASIYSVSNTAKLGGHIGWIDQNKLSKKIINEIKNISIGEITKPISLSNGFLILKLNEVREKKITLDKDKLLNNLVSFEKEKQYNQFSLSYFNKVKLNMEIND